MSDKIKEILDKAKEISDYGADGKQHTRMFNQFEAKALLDYITNLQQENDRLNNIINELEKSINEEIDDAQEELNIILQGNDLDYKNECTKEFNCIKNALDMLLDKLKELKENNNEC